MAALVLIAQADDSQTTMLTASLAEAGYETRTASTGTAALDLAQWHQPNLILLDTTLADGSGLEVCRTIRATSNVPLILLSDRVDEVDRIVGFELGADDYVSKPFSIRELLCRVRAVLRRAYLLPERDPALTQPFGFGEIRVDPVRQDVTRRGEPVILTRREYQLLHFLVRNPGRVFSDRQLVDYVWGPRYRGTVDTVRVHMRSLRTKLEDDPAQPRFLRTVHRRGYCFDEQGACTPERCRGAAAGHEHDRRSSRPA
jgi:two-component system, OmpR family, response regulator RegX3